METTFYNKALQRTVLVVDDEAINREMLGAILETEYTVIYAENGKDALSQINAHKDTLSLILLDILMPQVNGYEVLEKIHNDTSLSKIRVVVLNSEKSAEIKSLQMGAADFLTKPYDLPEVIRARVRHAITLFEDANLIRATEYDRLTGLYNREFFFEYGQQIDVRYPDRVMDAIVVDFNHSHLINEIYGRE